jgi:D-alanine-D-alanine ligase
MSVSQKLKVGIVFGGRSAEHQVSLQSAKSIIDAIDQDKYEPVLIGITPDGQWLLNESSQFLLNASNPKTIELSSAGQSVALMPSHNKGEIIQTSGESSISQIDVLFPVLHGPYGEDGSIQGLAKLANIPCVGSGIIGSAVGMDKDFTKRLLMLAGLNVADYALVSRGNLTDALIADIENRLNYPVFVKPANMGSSIGVSKADNRDELATAVAGAAKYDRKVLVEAAIVGREIECAVLGNDDPRASICGEIAAQHQFYDYDSKYIESDGAELSIPAKLSEDETKKIQEISKQVFSTLECRGLSRVDVFLTPEGEVYINEVNTMPGFTNISMYPKLWEHSGVTYSDLIDQLIQLSIEDFQS